MLNLKKLIASIAAITVAFSTVAFAATYTDVAEDSAYYEAVESLGKLGIVTGYEDGSYKPEETVTRAEMAALIARIQGYEETAKGSANTVFTDVPSSHWASGYIAQASNQGIVNGYGDGTFGPEDPVLYEQAVKMIMATLGYTPFAEQNGSYPTGYLSAASRYEVTKGVSNAVIGEGANRGTVAQLLANAIDTPIMGQSKWSTNGEIEYTIYDGVDAVYKTLMSENLGVTKLKGVVTENTVVNILGAKNIDTTELPAVKVAITGNFDSNNKDFAYVAAYTDASGNYNAAHYTYNDYFLVGETDAEDYIGMAVIFYVVENDIEDKYEILSIAADSTKNETLTFTLDQFDKVEADTNGDYTTIRYYKNETDRTSSKATINAGIQVVYNNVAVNTGIQSVLDDGNSSGFITGNGASKFGGQVTLVDYNGVAGYDIAFIDVAATAVVKKAAEEGVYFKKGIVLPNSNSLSELEIDPEDEEKVVVITKDGEAVDPSTLVEWDVLSIIAYSDNAGYITAEVISAPVVGVVGATFTSKTSKGGVGYVIDGTKYDVAEGAYDAVGIEVGEGGTFYIDNYGKIAAFNEDSALATGVAGNYGYVTKSIVENDEIDGKTVTVQMVTANGIEIFDLATSVSYKTAGGSSTIKPETATITTGQTAEDAADTFFGSSIKGQVIKYTTNSNGKLNNIILANYDDKFETETATNGNFDADNSKIGTMYMDSDSIIFFVDYKTDAQGNATSDFDTDKCQVGAVTDLEDETPYTVLAAYSDSKAEDSNIIVIQGGLTSVSPTSGVAVITSVAVSEVDGDKVYALSYLLNGEEVSAETIAFTDLTTNYAAPGTTEVVNAYTDAQGNQVAAAAVPTVGDVVKVKLNAAGKISGLNYVYNMGAAVRTAGSALNAKLAAAAGNTTNGEYVAAGYATAYKESSEQITLNGAATQYKLSQADYVYVVDATGRTPGVKNGSSSNYRYYENLYSDTNKSTIKVDGVAVTAYTDVDKVNDPTTWNAAVADYTDYVFVRMYDGKVKEVVIVKGAADVTVSQGAAIQ